SATASLSLSEHAGGKVSTEERVTVGGGVGEEKRERGRRKKRKKEKKQGRKKKEKEKQKRKQKETWARPQGKGDGDVARSSPRWIGQGKGRQKGQLPQRLRQAANGDAAARLPKYRQATLLFNGLSVCSIPMSAVLYS
ncbi:hypothetical protein LTR28_008592, partial [Elasticomyces elasticus]